MLQRPEESDPPGLVAGATSDCEILDVGAGSQPPAISPAPTVPSPLEQGWFLKCVTLRLFRKKQSF